MKTPVKITKSWRIKANLLAMVRRPARATFFAGNILRLLAGHA